MWVAWWVGGGELVFWWAFRFGDIAGELAEVWWVGGHCGQWTGGWVDEIKFEFIFKGLARLVKI